jgi:hypothetical protein
MTVKRVVLAAADVIVVFETVDDQQALTFINKKMATLSGRHSLQ